MLAQRGDVRSLVTVLVVSEPECPQLASDALREQKTASTDVARNVESIAQMSEENAAAIVSVASTAQQLVQSSEALKTTVSRFRL